MGDLHQNRGYDPLCLLRVGGRRDGLAINPQTVAQPRAYLARAGHADDMDGPLFQPLRRGLGGALIMDATRRAADADPAIFALVVDAKDENAAGCYEHLGFERFASWPLSLFLPIATALAALM